MLEDSGSISGICAEIKPPEYDLDSKIPEPDLKSLEKDCFEALKHENNTHSICLVCDSIIRKSEEKSFKMKELPIKKMEQVLKPEKLPIAIYKCYDLSYLNAKFENMLLSVKGYHSQSKTFTICVNCYTSLKGSSKHPPKFSIANGTWFFLI